MADEQNIAHLIEEFKKQAKDQAASLGSQQRKLEQQRKEDIARDVFSTKMRVFNTFIGTQRHKLSKDLQARGIRTEKATEERDTKGSLYNRQQAGKGPSNWQTAMLDTTAGFAPKVIEEAGNVKALTNWNLEGGLTKSIQKGLGGELNLADFAQRTTDLVATVAGTQEMVLAEIPNWVYGEEEAEKAEKRQQTWFEKFISGKELDKTEFLAAIGKEKEKEGAKEKEKENEDRRERKSMMDVLKGIGGGIKKFAAGMGRKAVGGLKAMFAGLAAVLGLAAWLLFVDSPAWDALIQKIKFGLVPFLKALPGKIDKMWGDFIAWWDDPEGGLGLIKEFKDAKTAFTALGAWIGNTAGWMKTFVAEAEAKEAARAAATGELPRAKPEVITTAIVAATVEAIGNYVKDNKEGWKTAIKESFGISTWEELLGKIVLTGAGLTVGKSIGMKVGFAFGPLGIIVGGIVGALIGGFVGYYQGNNIVKAGSVVATALGDFFSTKKTGANWGAVFGITLTGIAAAVAAPFTGGLSLMGFLAIMTTGAVLGGVAGSIAEAKFDETEKEKLKKVIERNMALEQMNFGERWLEHLKAIWLWDPFGQFGADPWTSPGTQAADKRWDEVRKQAGKNPLLPDDPAAFYSDFEMWQINTRNTATQKMNEFKTGWSTFWTNTGDMIRKISPFSSEAIQSDDADTFRVEYLAFFKDIRENWKSWFVNGLRVLAGLPAQTPKTPDPNEAVVFKETWVDWLFKRIYKDTMTQLRALGGLVMFFINPPTGKEIMDSLPLIVRDPLEWFINLFKPFADVETDIAKIAEKQNEIRKAEKEVKSTEAEITATNRSMIPGMVLAFKGALKREGILTTEENRKLWTAEDILAFDPKRLTEGSDAEMIRNNYLAIENKKIALQEKLLGAENKVYELMNSNSVTGESFLTHDTGLHRLIKEGNDMWKNSIILQQAYGGGGGGTTIINNNYNTTSVVAPTTSNRSNVKIESGNSVFDPHTSIRGPY